MKSLSLVFTAMAGNSAAAQLFEGRSGPAGKTAIGTGAPQRTGAAAAQPELEESAQRAGGFGDLFAGLCTAGPTDKPAAQAAALRPTPPPQKQTTLAHDADIGESLTGGSAMVAAELEAQDTDGGLPSAEPGQLPPGAVVALDGAEDLAESAKDAPGLLEDSTGPPLPGAAGLRELEDAAAPETFATDDPGRPAGAAQVRPEANRMPLQSQKAVQTGNAGAQQPRPASGATAASAESDNAATVHPQPSIVAAGQQGTERRLQHGEPADARSGPTPRADAGLNAGRLNVQTLLNRAAATDPVTRPGPHLQGFSAVDEGVPLQTFRHAQGQPAAWAGVEPDVSSTPPTQSALNTDDGAGSEGTQSGPDVRSQDFRNFIESIPSSAEERADSRQPFSPTQASTPARAAVAQGESRLPNVQMVSAAVEEDNLTADGIKSVLDEFVAPARSARTHARLHSEPSEPMDPAVPDHFDQVRKGLESASGDNARTIASTGGDDALLLSAERPPGPSNAADISAPLLKDAPPVQVDPQEPAETIRKLVQSMNLKTLAGRNMMQIQLKPEALGGLKIEVLSADNQVQIRMAAESSQVKQMLEEHLHSLKTELRSHGLELIKFDVFIQTSPDGGENSQSFTALNYFRQQSRDQAGADSAPQAEEFAATAEDENEVYADSAHKHTQNAVIDFFA